MSSEFKQFSDAARLYAKYTHVVDEVERMFVSNISEFLAAVRKRMQVDLPDAEVKEDESKEYLWWWIETKDTDPDANVPYVWIERRNAEIVVPGVLTVIADIEEVTDAEKHHLAAAKSSLYVPGHCTILGRRLFGLSIKYGDRDPVEACALPILTALKALHEAKVSWDEAQSASKGARAKGRR